MPPYQALRSLRERSRNKWEGEKTDSAALRNLWIALIASISYFQSLTPGQKHISHDKSSTELIMYFYFLQVLCLGLSGNVLRFLYISWLKNPWWVLPFEFIQGITHASVWAACCSYIAHNTPLHLRSNAQGVLQGLHHGLGRGCGAVIGGMCVAGYGKKIYILLIYYV